MRLRATLLLILFICVCAVAQVQVFLSWNDARRYVETISPDALPAELKTGDRASKWPEWVRERDRQVRARLERGEDDTLYNFLMFGTSFTKQPRLTEEYMAQVERAGGEKGEAQIGATFAQRVEDLIQALTKPNGNERLLFIRDFLRGRGFDLNTPDGQKSIRAYFASNALRVVREYDQFTKELRAARASGNPTEEIAARAVLFRDRGIALDTSLLPDYALETALTEMKKRELYKPGSIQRIAIIGPGLDFIDKSGGYDFYPQQSTQPFAVIDSLLRLGLASKDLKVTTLDISNRVNDHLDHARQRANLGESYRIELVRDPSAGWHKEVIAFWQNFGSYIGTSVKPAPLPPEFKNLQSRALSVRSDFVKRITAVDLNAVYQHLELEPEEKFDLVIATNILVYYDVFEQQLALANLEHMLRPGGFLLTNNAMLELPNARFKGVDYTAVPYSDKHADGDQIFWYQLQPAKAEQSVAN
jgi:SAM-dependent methyltransferase